MAEPPCTKRLYRLKINHTSILVKLYKVNNQCYFDLDLANRTKQFTYILGAGDGIYQN